MSITLKIVNLIDKLHLQNFFAQKDNKVMINISFDPTVIEDAIDELLKVDGRPYTPSQLEIDDIDELEC